MGSGHAGGLLVLRALTTNGTVYRIDGGMAELDAILDDDCELLLVNEVRIAKRQPRPMPPK